MACETIPELTLHKIDLYFTVVNQRTNLEIFAQGFYEDSFKNVVPGIVTQAQGSIAFRDPNE